MELINELKSPINRLNLKNKNKQKRQMNRTDFITDEGATQDEFNDQTQEFQGS